jgi:hypothetical protein
MAKFLIIGPDIEKMYGSFKPELYLQPTPGGKKRLDALFVYDPKKAEGPPNPKDPKIYFKDSTDLTVKISQKFAEINETEPQEECHLILNAHGSDGKVDGEFPEKLLHDTDLGGIKTTLSVFSCQSGTGIKSHNTLSLAENQKMVIYAGKRDIYHSQANPIKRRLVDFEDPEPRLIYRDHYGKVKIAGNDTVKIVTSEGTEKFSPFHLFKNGGRPSKEQIVQNIKDRQIEMLRVFNGGVSDEEIAEINSLNPSEKEIDRHLRDLHFVAGTKNPQKAKKYQDLLAEDFGVDSYSTNRVGDNQREDDKKLPTALFLILALISLVLGGILVGIGFAVGFSTTLNIAIGFCVQGLVGFNIAAGVSAISNDSNSKGSRNSKSDSSYLSNDQERVAEDWLGRESSNQSESKIAKPESFADRSSLPSTQPRLIEAEKLVAGRDLSTASVIQIQ